MSLFRFPSLILIMSLSVTSVCLFTSLHVPYQHVDPFIHQQFFTSYASLLSTIIFLSAHTSRALHYLSPVRMLHCIPVYLSPVSSLIFILFFLPFIFFYFICHFIFPILTFVSLWTYSVLCFLHSSIFQFII